MNYYSRHGLGRTDFYILNDPELSFREIVQKNLLSAVSGSFSTDMLDVSKSESTKAEILKIEAAKLETAKLEPSKSEVAKVEPAKTEVAQSESVKSEVTKSEESTKVEAAKSESHPELEIKDTETVKPEVQNNETDKPEETNTDAIKKESTETEETIQIDKVVISESMITSNESKVPSTGDIMPDKSQDVEKSVEENAETSDEKIEPMDVDSEDNKLEISKDNCEQEVSAVESKPSNDKNSDVIDEQTNSEKPEIANEIKKQTDTPKKDETQVKECEKTVTNINVESISKELKAKTYEIPSEKNNKIDNSVIEKIEKIKECSSSVESVDRLKAMFPELEVVHKDLSNPSVDKLPMHKPLQQIDQTIAHLLATSYQNPIKWPKVKPIYKV